MRALLARAATVLVSAGIFALLFAVSGCVLRMLIAQFSYEAPEPQHESALAFYNLLMAVAAVTRGAMLGLAVGAVYALAPKQLRNIWFAIVLGPAAFLIASPAHGLDDVPYPDFWKIVGGVMFMMMSALSVFILRALRLFAARARSHSGA